MEFTCNHGGELLWVAFAEHQVIELLGFGWFATHTIIYFETVRGNMQPLFVLSGGTGNVITALPTLMDEASSFLIP